MPASRHQHPNDLREEAFDLFAAGLSIRRVFDELHALYAADAPAESTLRRWSVEDRWTRRRVRIRSVGRARADARRALAGPELTAELHKMRRLVVEAVDVAPFTTAEGALYALAALERVIARHEDREAERTFQEQVRSARALYTFLEAGEPAEPGDRPADPLPGVTPLG